MNKKIQEGKKLLIIIFIHVVYFCSQYKVPFLHLKRNVPSLIYSSKFMPVKLVLRLNLQCGGEVHKLLQHRSFTVPAHLCQLTEDALLAVAGCVGEEISLLDCTKDGHLKLPNVSQVVVKGTTGMIRKISELLQSIYMHISLVHT